MKEIVIFPNINQIIDFREIQKSLCLIPSLPICIRSPALSEMDVHVESVTFSEISEAETVEGKKLFLRSKIIIDGKEFEAEMELGKAKCDVPVPAKKDYPKKLKSFRLVEMEYQKKNNGFTWEIFSEKWIKTKA
ncbi:MAG: hypothetical protein IJ727_05920 [Treponema sp.]|nr:hypothetical protein [Treponema sp.]